MVATLEPPAMSSTSEQTDNSAKVASGKIIGVTNNKGGVGKSTISTHLAYALQARGAAVSLLDADKQSSSSLWINDAGLDVPVFKWRTPHEIHKGIKVLTQQGQLVIADGPAGDGEANRALMLRSDYILLPCGPSKLDLDSLEETLATLFQCQEIRPDNLPRALILPNKTNVRQKLTRDLEVVLADARFRGIPVLPSIRQRTAFPESRTQNTVIWGLSRREHQAAMDEMDAVVDAVLAYITKDQSSRQ